jgi:hypothetical protein
LSFQGRLFWCLFTPYFAPAQEDKMTPETNTHHFSNWAKQRLHEIEATLRALESRATSLESDTRKHAEKTISDIKTQREAFHDTLQKHKHEGEEGLSRAMSGLEQNWASFEGLVHKYLSETPQAAKQLQETFAARAEAQTRAWHEALEGLRGKAAGFAAAHKQEVDEALQQLKVAAEGAKSRLEAQKNAGVHSWEAFRTALEESRSTFDKASRKALELFKKPSETKSGE